MSGVEIVASGMLEAFNGFGERLDDTLLQGSRANVTKPRR